MTDSSDRPVAADSTLVTEVVASRGHRLLAGLTTFSSVLAAAFAGIGWLVNYNLILSKQSALAVAQSKLAEVQVTLSGEQGRLADEQLKMNRQQTLLFKAQADQLGSLNRKLDDEIVYAQNRVKLTMDLDNQRGAITPKIVFGKFDTIKNNQSTILVQQSLTNIGTYSARVDLPVLKLSKFPFGGDGNSSDTLVEGKDFEFLPMTPGMMPAGYTNQVVHQLHLLNPALKGRPLYILLTYHMKADEVTIQSIARLLHEQNPSEDLTALGTFTYVWTQPI